MSRSSGNSKTHRDDVPVAPPDVVDEALVELEISEVLVVRGVVVFLEEDGAGSVMLLLRTIGTEHREHSPSALDLRGEKLKNGAADTCQASRESRSVNRRAEGHACVAACVSELRCLPRNGTRSRTLRSLPPLVTCDPRLDFNLAKYEIHPRTLRFRR